MQTVRRCQYEHQRQHSIAIHEGGGVVGGGGGDQGVGVGGCWGRWFGGNTECLYFNPCRTLKPIYIYVCVCNKISFLLFVSR